MCQGIPILTQLEPVDASWLGFLAGGASPRFGGSASLIQVRVHRRDMEGADDLI